MIYLKPRQRQTPENDLVKEFTGSNFCSTLASDATDLLVLEEPFTGFGFSDIVIINYNKNLFAQRQHARQHLQKNDIKILFHLQAVKKYISVSALREQLGYPTSLLNKSITRLADAGLISVSKKNEAKMKPIREIFFIEEIISVEAKLRDWQKAMFQSMNNTHFSSKSFVLFPERIISKNLLAAYQQTKIGIISHRQEFQVIKHARKNRIPANISAWYFNEYVGRRITEEFYGG